MRPSPGQTSLAIEPAADEDELPKLVRQLVEGEIAATSAPRERDAVLVLADRLLESKRSSLADAARSPGLRTTHEAGADLARLFEQAVGEAGRRDRGAVYTPPEVVRFIVREALTARVSAEFGVSLEVGRRYLVPDEA